MTDHYEESFSDVFTENLSYEFVSLKNTGPGILGIGASHYHERDVSLGVNMQPCVPCHNA